MSVNNQFIYAIHQLMEAWEKEMQELEMNEETSDIYTGTQTAKRAELQLKIERLRKFIIQHDIPQRD